MTATDSRQRSPSWSTTGRMGRDRRWCAFMVLVLCCRSFPSRIGPAWGVHRARIRNEPQNPSSRQIFFGSAMTSESEGSVTQWVGELKAGDPEAVRRLWERYFADLVRLARSKLRDAPPRPLTKKTPR